jgi:hypothetical protein
MSRKWKLSLKAATTMGLLLGLCGMAAAQYKQSGQSQQPAQSTEKPKTPEVTPLTLDATPPPVNAEEDAAFKAYQDSPPSDWPKKIELGEAFVQKYPQSRYLPPIYSGLATKRLSSLQPM